jgi:hypothetical protein
VASSAQCSRWGPSHYALLGKLLESNRGEQRLTDALGEAENMAPLREIETDGD